MKLFKGHDQYIYLSTVIHTGGGTRKVTYDGASPGRGSSGPAESCHLWVQGQPPPVPRWRLLPVFQFSVNQLPWEPDRKKRKISFHGKRKAKAEWRELVPSLYLDYIVRSHLQKSKERGEGGTGKVLLGSTIAEPDAQGLPLAPNSSARNAEASDLKAQWPARLAYLANPTPVQLSQNK